MATHAGSRLSSIDHDAIVGRAHRGRRRLKGLLLLGAAAALCALWAPSAQAGTYRVAQCTSGHAAAPDYVFSGNAAEISFSDSCATGGYLELAGRGDGFAPYLASGRWSLTAPAGTKVEGVDVSFASSTTDNFYSWGIVEDGGGANWELAFLDLSNGGWRSASWSGTGRSMFYGELICGFIGNTNCSDSGTASLRMKDLNTRLSDTAAPTVTPANAGLFAPGSRSGAQDATVTGSDSLGGGIQELSIEVNGTAAGTQDYSSSGCQLLPDGARAKRPRACNASEVKTWSLNTAAAPFQEGTNSVRVCSEDYAENRSGNRTCTTRNVVVDNVAPNTTITSGPAEGSTVLDQNVSFGFTSNETGTFQCQREQRNEATQQVFVVEPYAPCSSPKAYNNLDKGTYRFCVRAVDQATPPNIDPTPACRTFTIDPPSLKCDRADSAIYDGYTGTTYVKLRGQRGRADDPNAPVTFVCVRLDNRQGVSFGGSFEIADPSAGPSGPPRTDANGGACRAAGGTGQGGEIGNPGEPGYAKFDIASTSVAGETWVCVNVEGTVPFSQRVIVPLPGTSVSVPTFTVDGPGINPDPSQPPPSGYPSARCEQTAGGTKDAIANGDTPAGHLYAHSRRSGNSAALCVRLAGGALTIGGELKVDASAITVPPVIGTDTDASACSSNVITLDPPADVRISRSPGTSPASICFQQGATKRRIWVDPQGTGTAVVAFSPDPDVTLP